MRLRRSWSSPSSGTMLGDVVFNIFLSFIIFTALLAILAAIPKKEQQEEKTKQVKRLVDLPLRATLVFTITWPLGSEDIDLWAIGPDEKAVGYPAGKTRSQTLGYLRDDTGHQDKSNMNYELITAPGFVPGHYVMNVHFFDNHEGENRVTVDCQVLLQKKNNNMVEIYRGKVTLEYVRQEKTVIQFDLENDWSVTNISHDHYSIKYVY